VADAGNDRCGAATGSRSPDSADSVFTIILPLPFEVPHFNLAMAWHPRAQHDDALHWLRDCFLDAMPPGAAVGA
jgi:DNA-binding transcriptional LysR family regulator